LSGFHWVVGENQISTYQSADCGKRTFCGKCGSVIPIVEAERGIVFCPAGNLDAELGTRERFTGATAPAYPAYSG
jgi:hypothetical protein